MRQGRRAFEAALFQRINPKGWVFALGALAAYTTVGADVSWETSVIAPVLAVAAFNWSMAGLLVLSLIPVSW